MSTFEYTTIEQQIAKLKSQLLTFGDEEFAKQTLSTYGYYNIINGYRDPYLIREYDQKKYSPDVSFEQIFSLFLLDHRMRDAILLAMIDFEEHLKAVVSDIIAKDFGTDYMEYLKNENYRDKYVSNPYFRRNRILQTMRQEAETSNTQPIKYYREQHGIIPPWILLKGITFGTLVNFIRFFKREQRNQLIAALYGIEKATSYPDFLKDLLSDTLFLLLEYRNLSAHGGRIYNYIPNSRIRTLANSDLNRGLSQFLFVLREIKYQNPCRIISSHINDALTAYCSKFPNDVARLEMATGIRIETEETIYINPKTRKMHHNAHCSGCNNLREVPLTDDILKTFTPCKRCCLLKIPKS